MSITERLREIAAKADGTAPEITFWALRDLIAELEAAPAGAHAEPAGDADMQVAQAAIASRDERIAGLEADLVEERNRIASMRTEWGSEVAALTTERNIMRDNWAAVGTAHEAAMRRIAELEARRVPDGWVALTDEDRTRAFESLPNMLEGFLKLWGWLDFAKAIEAICREKNATRKPSGEV